MAFFQFEVDELDKKDADTCVIRAFMLHKNTRLQDISRILYEFCSLFPTNMVKQEENRSKSVSDCSNCWWSAVTIGKKSTRWVV